ncbi:TetR/AcrR family transcriptional regulator [Mycolicibacterium cosmeticum]|uniref:TetR family transcriptional regulator n=1 Tax=Mycolicibacterium cosmeticum TaxID=258533 RepID=W9AM60_MYCCO|nr:TetR/AcrR family transcriptional regulator [Mycolicibacterium cosmeticum]TLH68115.1 TetR/AcrR family transcriptional regulator [Mycolicibacterium cosmeticum]CDO06804.1 TetR family transcriptional regulator [Mycolicibacterium cosmeticum]
MSPGRADWLLGGDRREAAAERIYAAAADMMGRGGFGDIDIDALAAAVHCSRATVYRHAGTKAQIRDAVLARSAARIVETVRAAVHERTGTDRVLTAIAVALREIRADPLAATVVGAPGARSLTSSDAVMAYATEFAGVADDDPEAAQWIVRVVLALLFWPAPGADVEARLLQRFVAPGFG